MITSLVVTNTVILGVTNYLPALAAGFVVADEGNQLIRYIRLSDGWITTLAGQAGVIGFSNATGANATFNYPVGLAGDGNGNVYIADSKNNAIRVMNLYDPAFGVAMWWSAGQPFASRTASLLPAPTSFGWRTPAIILSN